MKRSEVVLLLMGTAAVGGGAYAMMPSENCRADRAAIAGTDGAPGPQDPRDCARRTGSSWSSGGHGSSSRSWGFFDDSSSSSSSHGTTSSSAPGDSGSHVTRGGFGSFAHAIGAHFSGG